MGTSGRRAFPGSSEVGQSILGNGQQEIGNRKIKNFFSTTDILASEKSY
jgi:hypothetical protein